jgi:hypothetical protein
VDVELPSQVCRLAVTDRMYICNRLDSCSCLHPTHPFMRVQQRYDILLVPLNTTPLQPPLPNLLPPHSQLMLPTAAPHVLYCLPRRPSS